VSTLIQFILIRSRYDFAGSLLEEWNGRIPDLRHFGNT